MTSIVPSRSVKESLEKRVTAYEEQLKNSDTAISYLEIQRSLSPETVSSFRLGYIDEPVSPEDHGRRGMLVLPYITPTGITQLKFRDLRPGSTNKYIYDIGSIHRPFNVGVLQLWQRDVVLTEGEFDCISFAEIGVAAVGLPGVGSWKECWSRIFRNRKITIFCDGDEPGRAFGLSLMEKLPGSRMVVAPDGEDANSILVEAGSQELRRFISISG